MRVMLMLSVRTRTRPGLAVNVPGDDDEILSTTENPFVSIFDLQKAEIELDGLKKSRIE
jgi:hypothetical protein